MGKIIKFPEQTELQKARSRMDGDEELFQGFRKSLEDAAEDADFPTEGTDELIPPGGDGTGRTMTFVIKADDDLEPIDDAMLAEILADYED